MLVCYIALHFGTPHSYWLPITFHLISFICPAHVNAQLQKENAIHEQNTTQFPFLHYMTEKEQGEDNLILPMNKKTYYEIMLFGKGVD